jgi:hypothetical protein
MEDASRGTYRERVDPVKATPCNVLPRTARPT